MMLLEGWLSASRTVAACLVGAREATRLVGCAHRTLLVWRSLCSNTNTNTNTHHHHHQFKLSFFFLAWSLSWSSSCPFTGWLLRLRLRLRVLLQGLELLLGCQTALPSLLCGRENVGRHVADVSDGVDCYAARWSDGDPGDATVVQRKS